MRTLKRTSILAATVAAMCLAVAAPAQAQTQQEGLVNVAVQDVVVQAPISLAANICDVNVAVLAEVADEAEACEATAASFATAGPSSNAPVRQDGLVNVLIDDVLVQAPISVAANVCDVNVAVLAQLDDEAEACDADAESIASRGVGGGGQGGAGGGLFIPVDIDLTNLLNLTDGTPISILG